jgi:creatinine amidohydrolase
MENFPWTRLANIAAPSQSKPGFDRDLMKASPPKIVREILGDGAFGGDYQKPDDVMLDLWRTGVEETRELLEGPWPAFTPA